MCGVVGFSSGKGHSAQGHRESFIRLCRESRIRGVHAFGIAWWDGELHCKRSTDYQEVIDAIPDPLPDRIIFHNRYCTSGDYKIPENNQPIVAEGCALVFNGTIDMGTKAEMEARSGYKLNTENDGELVLRDYLAGDAMRRLRARIATFAGIFLDGSGRMIALRNELRPLNVIKLDGCTMLCSTKDIASRAKFEKNYVEPLEPLKEYEL